MLTKYAKKIIKTYNINDLIYVEEQLDDSVSDYHLWSLYLVLKENDESIIHCYKWKYTFEQEQEIKGYSNIYEKILIKNINQFSRQDYIEITKKLEFDI